MNLHNYFDRVVVISLKRREDRLAQFHAGLRRCRWPFKWPTVFEAVDGRVSPRPANWPHGPGAWGCLKSHQQVLAHAIRDKVRSLLIMEDDACFAPRFVTQIRNFLRVVPEDWDQLMLGGQHMNYLGEPTLFSPGIYRCTDCERTHCYAIRGPFMGKLHDYWSGGGKYNGVGHCDWIMGRDPDLQFAHKVYSPQFFLVGQERSYSDIYGRTQPRKFWNPPSPDLWVVNLHAPPPVAAVLEKHGLCFGRGCGQSGDLSVKLGQLFDETKQAPPLRKKRLREWITLMQWELGADPGFVCAVMHPNAKPGLVKSASLWPVLEITASTVEEALRQLPRRMRKPITASGAPKAMGSGVATLMGGLPRPRLSPRLKRPLRAALSGGR